jgi:uncharacterized membrane protein
MKTKPCLLTLGILHLLLIFVGTALTSCQNPTNTQKAVAIGELGLRVLVAKNVLKPEEAELARQTGQILITPAAGETVLVSPEPSGK